jgi:hypothetical protein
MRILPGESIILHLGIDLRRKQMTVSLRNQSGDVLLRRQVSTRWPKMEEFRKTTATGRGWRREIGVGGRSPMISRLAREMAATGSNVATTRWWFIRSDEAFNGMALVAYN